MSNEEFDLLCKTVREFSASADQLGRSIRAMAAKMPSFAEQAAAFIAAQDRLRLTLNADHQRHHSEG